MRSRRHAPAGCGGHEGARRGASRYGATDGIAQAIAEVLAAGGHDVTVTPCEAVTEVESFDAAIVGSAVYAGHWLEAAKDLVHTHAAALRRRPVWLFSSGPVGDPPKPDEDPVDTADMVGASNPRDHRVFSGMLDRSKLRFTDKAIAAALRAPVGDFHDWDAIEGMGARRTRQPSRPSDRTTFETCPNRRTSASIDQRLITTTRRRRILSGNDGAWPSLRRARYEARVRSSSAQDAGCARRVRSGQRQRFPA